MDENRRVRVLIGSPLEPYLVERIAALDPRVEVVYRPDLVGTQRFPSDHTPPMSRTQAQEEEWARLMSEAEVMFDAYRPSSADLPASAPRLRWIQFTSSGVGHLIQQMGLRDSRVLVTNVAGIHARPLAEFVLFAMLYFAREIPRVLADQRRHHWERFAGQTLRGKSLGIVGLGHVGSEIAQAVRCFDVMVAGTRRSPDLADPKRYNVDVLYSRTDLDALLASSDYVVLAVPATPETGGMIGEHQLGLMKPGAVLINVSRGTVVDEAALVKGLLSGRLRGAALDVFATEPLPLNSPLWDMPNVLVTPHSMSTVVGENDLAVDIFVDNLRRYLEGEPLHHLFDRSRGY